MTPYFLIHVILCSLAIIALWNLFQPGQLFSWLGARVRRETTAKQAKPLVDCPVCMPSLYGSLYFAVFLWSEFDGWHRLSGWILFVLAVSGLNRLVILLPLKK